MSKKRSSHQHDSPEKYIRTRTRNLPIHECYINPGWDEGGMALIIVSRMHKTGNLTFGSYQVDLYCLGVKDTFWRFNVLPDDLEYIKDQYAGFTATGEPLIQADYALVHNIIYGAEAYADELGFKPHKDFALTQYILEEDDDKVEYIEIEFGMNGRPAVMLGMERYPPGVFNILDRSAGPGNYYVIGEDENVIKGPDTEDDTDTEEEAADNQGQPKPMNQDMMNLTQERLMNFLGEQNFESFEDVEEFLEKNLTGKKIDEIIPPKKGRRSNADKADDLMYEAYQSEPEDGINLAEQALELDPDNSRAYNYLAQTETVPAKAYVLFEKAALTEEKKLGKDFFKENAGHFWVMTETRPYMTALAGMAGCLTSMEKTGKAIEIYKKLLKLNPSDNQGVRYELSGLYLKNKKFESYKALYGKYEDDCAAPWLYNHAYYLYMTEGKGSGFTKALEKAYDANPHFINALAGKEELTDLPVEMVVLGSLEEAALYLLQHGPMWLENKELFLSVLDFERKKK